MFPNTNVPGWGVLLSKKKMEKVGGGALGISVKVLPAALASPVPAPVMASSDEMQLSWNVTSVTFVAFDSVIGIPRPVSLGTLMVFVPSGPRAKSGMLKIGLPALATANV